MSIEEEDRSGVLRQFGLRVHHLRKLRGLSQEALAMEAGFSRSYYSEIELGKRNVSIVNMCRLAKALGVSLKILTDFENGGCD